MSEDLIPLKEAADMLSVHVQTIRRAIQKGQLAKYTRFGVRGYFVKRSDIEALKDAIKDDASGE